MVPRRARLAAIERAGHLLAFDYQQAKDDAEKESFQGTIGRLRVRRDADREDEAELQRPYERQRDERQRDEGQ